VLTEFIQGENAQALPFLPRLKAGNIHLDNWFPGSGNIRKFPMYVNVFLKKTDYPHKKASRVDFHRYGPFPKKRPCRNLFICEHDKAKPSASKSIKLNCMNPYFLSWRGSFQFSVFLKNS